MNELFKPLPERAGIEAESVGNDLLTIGQLADLLGVKVSWLYAQTSAKKIPFLKLGGRLRFRRADVERWIEGQVVHPMALHSRLMGKGRIRP